MGLTITLTPIPNPNLYPNPSPNPSPIPNPYPSPKPHLHPYLNLNLSLHPDPGVDDFKLEFGAGVGRESTLMDERGKGPSSVGESLFGGDELGLQYTQNLAEQLAQMCMTE